MYECVKWFRILGEYYSVCYLITDITTPALTVNIFYKVNSKNKIIIFGAPYKY